MSNKNHVVFVHGFAAKRVLLIPLERRIRSAGFRTSRWGYISLYGSIERHARRLRQELIEMARRESHLHLVAHSMGSIVARVAIAMGSVPGLERVVLIAPPNRGSPIARIAGPALRPVCPAISELSTAPQSLVNRLGQSPEIDFGVIAAKFDWLIPCSKTVLAEQADHICLRATHTSLLFQAQAARQVVEFLTHGRFDHSSSRRLAS